MSAFPGFGELGLIGSLPESRSSRRKEAHSFSD